MTNYVVMCGHLYVSWIHTSDTVNHGVSGILLTDPTQAKQFTKEKAQAIAKLVNGYVTQIEVTE